MEKTWTNDKGKKVTLNGESVSVEGRRLTTVHDVRDLYEVRTARLVGHGYRVILQFGVFNSVAAGVFADEGEVRDMTMTLLGLAMSLITERQSVLKRRRSGELKAGET